MEYMEYISNYEGLYSVTPDGKVFSHLRGKYLTQKKDKHGYLYVGLSKKGHVKYFRVHRLVAKEFIPNPNNYDTVDHIDFNKENNNVENLRWLPNYINCVRQKTLIKNESITSCIGCDECTGKGCAKFKIHSLLHSKER